MSEEPNVFHRAMAIFTQGASRAVELGALAGMRREYEALEKRLAEIAEILHIKGCDDCERDDSVGYFHPCGTCLLNANIDAYKIAKGDK